MTMHFKCCQALPLLIAVLVFARGAIGQSQLPLKSELMWFAPAGEILTPNFSPDGNYSLLVTRACWPDGGDAEGLPDSFFKKLADHAKDGPRFDNPVIKVIALSGNGMYKAQYGWNRSLSRDDKRLAFSEQVKPITGFRGLASRMSGNAIRMCDSGTKRSGKTADPDTGHADIPFSSSDRGSVVFAQIEAVNGAFGGTVGIARFDLQQNREVTPVNKKSVASFPCPPDGSEVSGLEAFKRPQVRVGCVDRRLGSREALS